jgi:hypothetical protein
MRRFSPSEIAILFSMAKAGANGEMIAKALNRTPQGIRVKCVELGIRLRRPRPTNDVRFVMDDRAFAKLKAEAKARGTNAARLARLLLEICVRNELVEELLSSTVALREFILSENAVPKQVAPDSLESAAQAAEGVGR